jgi:pimeloyl-ACP methyl ester carboxylesterase
VGALHGTGGVGLADLAADVAETITRRPVELVVGHSLGALTVMALLGRRNGWAPEPLQRLYRRVGLSESSSG